VKGGGTYVPPKIRGNVFSGNSHVKVGHFVDLMFYSPIFPSSYAYASEWRYAP